MKAIILLLVMSSVWAGKEKTIRYHDKGCRDKIVIEAKEGEKFVTVIHNSRRSRLKGELPYKVMAEKNLVFSSDVMHEKFKLGEPTFEFHLPSMVMSNFPEVKVFLSGTSYKCTMTTGSSIKD